MLLNMRVCGVSSRLMTVKATKGFIQFAKGHKPVIKSDNDDLPENFENGQTPSERNHCWADIFPLQPQLCHLLHHLPKPANREGLQGELEPNRNHLCKSQKPCEPKCPGYSSKITTCIRIYQILLKVYNKNKNFVWKWLVLGRCAETGHRGEHEHFRLWIKHF